MKRDPVDLARYTAPERANHLLTGITFVLLALSGLAFFHPAFYPLTLLFGGGVWTRILHPFIGLVMALSFASMFLRFWKLNIVTPADRKWLGRIGDLMQGKEISIPETGKYNGGQKVLFWLFAASMVLLLLTGIVIWRAWFSGLFPVGLVRFSSLVHAAVAAGMIILVIGHVYMAIWTKGSMRAMIYGTVRRAWAKYHHPAWFRQITGGDK